MTPLARRVIWTGISGFYCLAMVVILLLELSNVIALTSSGRVQLSHAWTRNDGDDTG